MHSSLICAPTVTVGEGRQPRVPLRHVFISCLATFFCTCALAQTSTGDDGVAPEPVIEVAPDVASDDQIEQRIEGIFDQIETLDEVTAIVRDGVVTLAGPVANERYAERAKELATRLQGVVTVEDRMERTLDVEGNVRPVVTRFRADFNHWVRALPLVALAALVFALIALLGHALASWSALWRRLAPNSFLASLMAQAVRIIAIVVGLIAGLSLLGATALMGTILGSAGVIGLAIGFAVRDTLENYISSIMLSLRQPFRANDHVAIDSHEGKVVRLTSRSTVLMTLDGNHLRIPNAMVYKAVILNYTRNPQRRFDFDIGIGANDDPMTAMQCGLDAMGVLEFVLDDPPPNALIREVGDSNIVLRFMAWVDQEKTGFGKARSVAIRSVTVALEARGITMPEPAYRLRLEGADAKTSDSLLPVGAPTPREAVAPAPPEAIAEQLDVRPDDFIETLVNEERTHDTGDDLLDKDRPIE